MEAKKQFIIVPPMTEPLVKLNETYEALSEKENLEITIIDDYLELSQYASFAGQCLIVFGNPKKCAHFLQENKNLISKNKPKILLISPIDIPAATKEKFSKVGLTESLVDSTPFKNLQFKVNMLLKSIKGNEQEKPNKVQKEHLVKSIVDTNHINNSEKLEIKSNSPVNNLSGKSSYKEEKIETHWSGQRKNIDSKIDRIEEDHFKIKSLEQKKLNETKNETDDESLKKRADKLEVIAPSELKQESQSTLAKESSADKKESKAAAPNMSRQSEEKIQARPVTAPIPSKNAITPQAKLVVEKNHKNKVEAEESIPKNGFNNKKIDSPDVANQKKLELKNNNPNTSDIKGTNSKAATSKDEETKKTLNHENKKDNSNDQKPKTMTRRDEIIDGKLRSKEDSEVEKIDNKLFGEYSFSDKTIAPTKEIILKESIPEDTSPEKSKANDKTTPEDEKAKNNPKKANILLNVLKKLGIAKKAPSEESQGTSRQSIETSIHSENLKPLTLENSQIKEQTSLHKKSSNEVETKIQKNIHNHDVDKIDMFYRGKKSNDDSVEQPSKDSKKIVLEIGKNSLKKDGASISKKKDKIIPEEMIIDYRKLKADFISSSSVAKQNQFNKIQDLKSEADNETITINEKPIFEVHSKGLDFSISMLNLVNEKNLSHESLFKHISHEITKQYNGYATFYQFLRPENHYQEIFCSFSKDEIPHLGHEHAYWFDNTLNNESEKQRLFSKTNTQWFCRELKTNHDSINFWEESELPSWASIEFKNKKVELYFPYFDGVELLGCVLLYFPYGINFHEQHSILLTIEIARSIFLDLMKKDFLEQSISLALQELELEKEKKKLVGKITNILKKNKAS